MCTYAKLHRALHNAFDRRERILAFFEDRSQRFFVTDVTLPYRDSAALTLELDSHVRNSIRDPATAGEEQEAPCTTRSHPLCGTAANTSETTRKYVRRI